ncbi:MAG: CSLREA domain-containing protein, partial [Chloroflexi bacterium]|nr:CSLREA domain-containing protein [Chloroflexota bacterium]
MTSVFSKILVFKPAYFAAPLAAIALALAFFSHASAAPPVQILASDLNVNVSVSETNPAEGEQVTFTITVTWQPNSCAGPTCFVYQDVIVAAPLPEGLTFVSDSGGPLEYFENGAPFIPAGTWDVGTMPPLLSDSKQIEIVARVNSGKAGDAITFNAGLHASTPVDSFDTADNSDSVTINVEGVDIEVVSKTVSEPNPTVGDSITYTVNIRNNGPDNATNVRILDLLPGGLSCTGFSASQGSYSCGTGVWSAGTLTDGATASLQIFAHVQGNLGQKITNTAKLQSVTQVDRQSNNDSKEVEITVRAADLRVSVVDDPDPVPLGGTLTYTITVTNDGPDVARNTVLTSRFPEALFPDPFPAGCLVSLVPGTFTVSCNLGDILAGEANAVTRVITVRATSPGSFDNKVEATATEGDPDTANNIVTANTVATILVNATDDVDNGCTSAHCNLREAIIAANADASLGVIFFGILGDGPHVFAPATSLPTITAPVIIDGYSQSGAAEATASTPPVFKIEIDGSGGGGDGLKITGDGSTIKGLVIRGFPGNGIAIEGGSNNLIEGNFIGTNKDGAIAEDNANGAAGVRIANGTNNTVGGATIAKRNLISGNGAEGVLITGSGSTGNVVQGNLIGTDVTGVVDLGNASHGVSITSFANTNTIGGNGAGARNVISGNDGSGVFIEGANTSSNLVQGNFIGTGVNGQSPLPNVGGGVTIQNASQNTIGGSVAGDGNVISGNTGAGISISGVGSTGNKAQGNLIGTNQAGTAALPNGGGGVKISGGASGNEIGGASTAGACSGACNLISGNTGAGVSIEGNATTSNTVRGNFIGTNLGGSARLQNTSHGVSIVDAPGNTVGGPNSPDNDANLISGNGGAGISISGATASGNTVLGNIIGTNIGGTAAIANTSHGINITDAPGNTIGGVVSAGGSDPCNGACNLISGNGGAGISISGATASGNVVQGNFVGTRKDGKAKLPNASHGVSVVGALNNSIGGDIPATPGQRPCSGTCNLISGNTGSGVSISGEAATGNSVRSNFIGTDSSGIVNIGNTSHGVRIAGGALNNRVGGATAEKNAIAFNGGDGVSIQAGTGNAALSNAIFNNGGLGIDLTNDGATFNDPGDADDGANRLQNFPFFATASMDDTGRLIIRYSVDSGAAAASFPLTVQFFKADSKDGGEGRIFLLSHSYNAGEATAELANAPSFGVKTGTPIVATVTDAANNTSEFSTAVPVNEPRVFVVNSLADGTPDICDSADCTLREAIIAANVNEGIRDFIHFNIPAG